MLTRREANTVPSAKKECRRTRPFYFGADALWASEAPNQIVRIAQKDLVSHAPVITNSAYKTMKSIRLNPNIPLTRKICADNAGYAPQALVPLYDVNFFFAPEQGSRRNFCLFKHGCWIWSAFAHWATA